MAAEQAGSCSSDWTPSLGTSICHRCGPKKQKQTKNSNNKNRTEDKNQMIISVDQEKSFDETQHAFMIKLLSKLGLGGTFLSPMQAEQPLIGSTPSSPVLLLPWCSFLTDVHPELLKFLHTLHLPFLRLVSDADSPKYFLAHLPGLLLQILVYFF